MKFLQRILLVSFLFMGVISVSIAQVKNAAPVPSVASDQAHVNINTATKQELAALPGFNPNKARAIVAWRKKNGPFASLDTLRQVTGFKRMSEQNFKDMEARLSVG